MTTWIFVFGILKENRNSLLRKQLLIILLVLSQLMYAYVNFSEGLFGQSRFAIFQAPFLSGLTKATVIAKLKKNKSFSSNLSYTYVQIIYIDCLIYIFF